MCLVVLNQLATTRSHTTLGACASVLGSELTCCLALHICLFSKIKICVHLSFSVAALVSLFSIDLPAHHNLTSQCVYSPILRIMEVGFRNQSIQFVLSDIVSSPHPSFHVFCVCWKLGLEIHPFILLYLIPCLLHIHHFICSACVGFVSVQSLIVGITHHVVNVSSYIRMMRIQMVVGSNRYPQIKQSVMSILLLPIIITYYHRAAIKDPYVQQVCFNEWYYYLLSPASTAMR